MSLSMKLNCAFLVLIMASAMSSAPGEAAELVGAKSKRKLHAVAAPELSEEQKVRSAIADQEELIDHANAVLQKLRFNSQDCVECYATYSGKGEPVASAAQKACTAKWKDFYNRPPLDPKNPDGEKKPVDVRIVFGYLDSDVDKMANDTLIRRTMVERVTAPCEGPLVRICGFKESKTDANIFESEVLGPTGEKQKMRLHLVASSYSVSDSANRAFSVEQEQQSARAEKTYYDGMSESQALFYVGHARKGGGPDFRAAKRRPNNSIDYDKYIIPQPGLKRLTAAIAAAGKTPNILGFFACDSNRWLGKLEKLAPKSGLLLSANETINFETALGFAYLSLDSILWHRCAGEFNRALNSLSGYYENKDTKGNPVPPLEGPKLLNFFPE